MGQPRKPGRQHGADPEIFAEHEVTATFFVLGLVAQRFPQLVNRIAAMAMKSRRTASPSARLRPDTARLSRRVRRAGICSNR